ncbi:MAG: hypothetical protein JWO85_2644 [Candidatus Eremiobacteraeota bacterium]|nr:hypothetical protein [Candidatus Eremiobacteraeota bacterium]
MSRFVSFNGRTASVVLRNVIDLRFDPGSDALDLLATGEGGLVHFGTAALALYRHDSSGVMVFAYTASTGGYLGRLEEHDFCRPDVQRQLVALFSVALRERFEPAHDDAYTAAMGLLAEAERDATREASTG